MNCRVAVVAAAVGVSLHALQRVRIRNPKKLYIIIILMEIRIIDNSNNALINA